MNTVNTIITPDLIDIYTYVARYIEESFEGETCAAVVGTVEKQFYSCLRGEYRVEVHKVNECGASSKEVGDIDVYEQDKCFYSVEVKRALVSACAEAPSFGIILSKEQNTK